MSCLLVPGPTLSRHMDPQVGGRFQAVSPKAAWEGLPDHIGEHITELGGSCAPRGGHMAEEPEQGPTMPPIGWVSESPS